MGAQIWLELPGAECVQSRSPEGEKVPNESLPVNATFDLRYLPQGAAADEETSEESETEADDVSTTFYREEEIDLAELLREQFYLALPMKPLCAESCKGLCPQCGVNLNVETCACKPQWEDPRLAGLKALITDRKPDDA